METAPTRVNRNKAIPIKISFLAVNQSIQLVDYPSPLSYLGFEFTEQEQEMI